MDVRDNFNDNMTTYVALSMSIIKFVPTFQSRQCVMQPFFFAGAALKRVAPAQPVVKLTNTI